MIQVLLDIPRTSSSWHPPKEPPTSSAALLGVTPTLVSPLRLPLFMGIADIDCTGMLVVESSACPLLSIPYRSVAIRSTSSAAFLKHGRNTPTKTATASGMFSIWAGTITRGVPSPGFSACKVKGDKVRSKRYTSNKALAAITSTQCRQVLPIPFAPCWQSSAHPIGFKLSHQFAVIKRHRVEGSSLKPYLYGQYPSKSYAGWVQSLCFSCERK